ncbi:MAG TPA: hypothetical protein DEG17_18345 [Cyanobacteria bacterium UBA11149]|nr:hypothetical protein [Cyanobacteria bacterium UBA11367]HBW90773.1 hypothetical protein [Cyanobacteria bacterium UBA11149]
MLQLGLNFPTIAEGLDLPLDVVQRVGESFQRQHVTAFMKLLKENRSLFSQEALAELAELVAPLPDEVADLAFAIALWLRKPPYSAQLNAWKQLLNTIDISNLNPVFRGDCDPVNTTEVTVNKQLLQRAIQGEA